MSSIKETLFLLAGTVMRSGRYFFSYDLPSLREANAIRVAELQAIGMYCDCVNGIVVYVQNFDVLTLVLYNNHLRLSGAE